MGERFARHDTGQSREITMERPTGEGGVEDGKKRRGRRKGVRRGRKRSWRARGREEGVGGGERRKKRERKERRREGEWCACLGAKSWASRAQAWPRLTLERSRSEVIIEHEPPSGSQPPLDRVANGIKLPH